MDFLSVVMGLAFALIWSSAFTTAHIIVAEAPPLTALVARFLASAVIGVGVALALGQSWRLTRAQWRGVVIFGLCQNALYLGFYWMAMQTVEAGLASIIAATMPLIVAALAWASAGERLAPLGVAGLVAGFAGVALIFGSRISGGADLWGLTLCVGGVLALAVATIVLRGAASGGNVIMVVGLQMLVGGIALIPFAAFETQPASWAFALSPGYAFAFIYTVLAPGVLATWIWFHLVERIGATRAATFHFLNPIFGVAIAAILLGERLGVLDMVGVVVTTLGILAVQLARAPGRAVAPPPPLSRG